MEMLFLFPYRIIAVTSISNISHSYICEWKVTNLFKTYNGLPYLLWLISEFIQKKNRRGIKLLNETLKTCIDAVISYLSQMRLKLSILHTTKKLFLCTISVLNSYDKHNKTKIVFYTFISFLVFSPSHGRMPPEVALWQNLSAHYLRYYCFCRGVIRNSVVFLLYIVDSENQTGAHCSMFTDLMQ